MDFLKALVGATALVSSSLAFSEVYTQRMEGLNGELVYGSAHYNALSSSGRYQMWVHLRRINNTTEPEFHIRDIKSGRTEAISGNFDSINSTCFALSANGRYAAYNFIEFEDGNIQNRIDGGIYLYDRVEDSHTQVTGPNNFNCEYNVKVSSEGDVAYYPSQGNLYLFDLSENTHTYIDGEVEVSNFSYDGGKLAYIDHDNSYRAYVYDLESGSSSLVSNTSVNKASLTGDGESIVYSTRLSSTINIQNLSSNTVQSIDLLPQHISGPRDLSASLDGQYVTFVGSIDSNHPDFDPNRLWTSRPFRLNTETGETLTFSTTIDDGGPLGFYNNTNFISADGSMMSYCSSAKNIVEGEFISAEEPYHAFSDDGFARRYMFIDIMSSDNAYMPFDPLTLIDDNLWEGIVEFDDVGSDFFFQTGGRWVDGEYQPTNDSAVWGDFNNDGIARTGETQIRAPEGAGKYRITFNDTNGAYTIEKLDTDIQRTVVFIYGRTNPGQDMFIRGGIDHAWANTYGGRNCTSTNYECSIPIISHNNTRNNTTAPWKVGDYFLDWYGSESSQSNESQGTPLDWTGNYWPSDWGPMKTVAEHGSGVTPLNTYGLHFWMLDVDLDCSRTENGWFELKSYISNGPGWENDVNQSGTPYNSRNHFARCGMKNVFFRSEVYVNGHGTRYPNDYIIEDI